jgi:hypothetical protein
MFALLRTCQGLLRIKNFGYIVHSRGIWRLFCLKHMPFFRWVSGVCIPSFFNHVGADAKLGVQQSTHYSGFVLFRTVLWLLVPISLSTFLELDRLPCSWHGGGLRWYWRWKNPQGSFTIWVPANRLILPSSVYSPRTILAIRFVARLGLVAISAQPSVLVLFHLVKHFARSVGKLLSKTSSRYISNTCEPTLWNQWLSGPAVLAVSHARISSPHIDRRHHITLSSLYFLL